MGVLDGELEGFGAHGPFGDRWIMDHDDAVRTHRTRSHTHP